MGSEYPGKNLETLLKAFKILKRDTRFRDLKLVKVGKPGGRVGAEEGSVRVVRELGRKNLTGYRSIKS